MKVYIVLYTANFEGDIYEGAFASKEVAEKFVMDTFGDSLRFYTIIEEEI